VTSGPFAEYHVVQWFGEDAVREELTPPTATQMQNLRWHIFIRNYITGLNHKYRGNIDERKDHS